MIFPLCTVYSQINTDGTALVNNEDLFLFIIFNANVANKRISIQHSKKGRRKEVLFMITFIWFRTISSHRSLLEFNQAAEMKGATDL